MTKPFTATRRAVQSVRALIIDTAVSRMTFPLSQELMVQELQEMGLEASIDRDTGLVDISNSKSEPPKFSYPGNGGGEQTP